MALFYAVATMGVFVALVAFAVDWGRVQLTRAELQCAADAAALHAAGGELGPGTLARASEVAAQNRAVGQPVVLAAADVLVGQWDDSARAFVAGSNSPTAVSITARATVPLMFGALIGSSECQVSARAVVVSIPAGGHGVVGLEFLKINSNSIIDGYDSAAGAYGGTNAGRQVTAATNGYTQINSASKLHGDLYRLAGESVQVSGGSALASPGSVKPLDKPLAYATEVAPASAIQRGNHTQDGGTLSLSTGSYVYDDLVINSGAHLAITGNVTIYVKKKFEVNSISTAAGQKPSQLRIVSLGTDGVSINSNSTLAANIYALKSEVLVNSGSTLYGSVVGRTVLVNTDSAIHCDGGRASPKVIRLAQ